MDRCDRVHWGYLYIVIESMLIMIMICSGIYEDYSENVV